MISFNDFLHNNTWKNKAASNIKIQSILSSLTPWNDVANYLRDGPFRTDEGIVTMHPTKGTHWIAKNNQNFLDSFGGHPPTELSKFYIKRNRH